jgi:hypothetical protein
MSSLVSSGDQSSTDQLFWKPLNTRRGAAKVLPGSAIMRSKLVPSRAVLWKATRLPS